MFMIRRRSLMLSSMSAAVTTVACGLFYTPARSDSRAATCGRLSPATASALKDRTQDSLEGVSSGGLPQRRA